MQEERDSYYMMKKFTLTGAPADFQLEGMSLRNNINFDSACGSPEFTNFTVGFEGCLDYIYYNTDLLLVEEVR